LKLLTTETLFEGRAVSRDAGRQNISGWRIAGFLRVGWDIQC